MNKLKDILNSAKPIVSTPYDLFLFILAPVLAVFLGANLYSYLVSTQTIQVASKLPYLVLILTHIHLTASLARAYGNKEVREANRKKLLFFPLLILSLVGISGEYFSTVLFFTLIIDALHTANQVYIFGRIYDCKSQVDAKLCKGSKLDFILSLFIHFIPIVWGVTQPEQIKMILSVGNDSSFAFSTIATDQLVEIIKQVRLVAPWVLLGYLLVYIFRYQAIVKKTSYKISPYKILFFITTFICNLYLWSKGDAIAALLAINLGHAVQYLALIGHTEKGQLSQKVKMGSMLSVSLVFLIGAVYGLLVSESLNPWVGKLALAVALIHYLLDAFMWNTRKYKV